MYFLDQKWNVLSLKISYEPLSIWTYSKYSKILDLKFHLFFILLLIPLNQCTFSVYLIKLTNFEELLCLKGSAKDLKLIFLDMAWVDFIIVH